MKRLKRGDIVEIKANKWRDSFGNTYHNVQVYVNDDYVGESGNTYGYGDHYMQTAREMIFDKYKAPYGYDASNPIYMLKDKGVKVTTMDSMVSRKRDLGYFERGGQVALAKAMGSVAKKGEREIEEGRAEIKGVRNRISQSEDKIRDYKSGINEENKNITKREGDIKDLKKELLDIDKTVKNAKKEQVKFAKGGSVGDKHEILVYYGQKPTRVFMSKDYSDDEAYEKFIDMRSENIKENDVVLLKNDEEIDYYDSEQDRLEDEDFAKGGPIYEGHKVRIKDSGKSMKVTDISKNKKDQVEFTGKEGTYLIGDIEKMAKGGSVGKKIYQLNSWYVDVYEDFYGEGEGDNVHNWDNSVDGSGGQEFSSKEGLEDEIVEIIENNINGVKVEKKWFDIDDEINGDGTTRISYSVNATYDDSYYGRYDTPTTEERKKWEKGEQKMFVLHFSFNVEVYTIHTEKKYVDVDVKKKQDYAKGGTITKKDGNEMFIGGLAGVLFGIFFGSK